MAAPMRLLAKPKFAQLSALCVHVTRLRTPSQHGFVHFSRFSTQIGQRTLRPCSSRFAEGQRLLLGKMFCNSHIVRETATKLGRSQLGVCKRTFSSHCKCGPTRSSPGNGLGQGHGKSLLATTPKNQHLLRTFGNRSKNPKKDINEEKSLVGSFLFTSGVCVVTYTGAMIWYYEDVRRQSRKFARYLERYNPNKAGFRQDMGHMWNNVLPGVKLVAGIIAINVAVFGCWRIPSLFNTMSRYFMANNTNPRSSMILSAFSHVNFAHLFVNMYVLWSFAGAITQNMGSEQFMAMYVSAAAISSFTSQINRFGRGLTTPSVGASGAMMAILGYYWHAHPEGRVSVAVVDLIFPHSFTVDTGVKFILTVDVLGLLLGWKLFDHAAHLGGLLFGYWYATYGKDLIWSRKHLLINKWRRLRERNDK